MVCGIHHWTLILRWRAPGPGERKCYACHGVPVPVSGEAITFHAQQDETGRRRLFCAACCPCYERGIPAHQRMHSIQLLNGNPGFVAQKGKGKGGGRATVKGRGIGLGRGKGTGRGKGKGATVATAASASSFANYRAAFLAGDSAAADAAPAPNAAGRDVAAGPAASSVAADPMEARGAPDDMLDS